MVAERYGREVGPLQEVKDGDFDAPDAVTALRWRVVVNRFAVETDFALHSAVECRRPVHSAHVGLAALGGPADRCADQLCGQRGRTG